MKPMKSIARCGVLLLSLAVPAFAGPSSWEDDQIELLALAGAADGSLADQSALTNLLAAWPDTIRVDANGRLEWKYQEDTPWVQADGEAISPVAADRDRLVALSVLPWVANSLPRYARSNVSDRHVNRSMKIAMDPAVGPAVKFLALANAGGRMYVLEKLERVSINGQVKLYYHGSEASNALGEIERLKIKWALQVAAETRLDGTGPASVPALASTDKPGRRLVRATAYIRNGGKPRMLWADFQSDRVFDRTKNEHARDVVAWRMDEFGKGAIPTDEDDALVHTCSFGLYEYVIVIGKLSHQQWVDLDSINTTLEDLIENFAKSGVVVIFSRPGSPLIGVPAR